MFNRVSADGYFADSSGTLDWVVPEPELDKAAVERLSDSDMMLFGRRTYEMFESFWPGAIDDSTTAQDPHGARRSPEIRAMAVWINQTIKRVFSSTRKDVTWANSQLVHELDPREIEALKEQPGKNILVFGSGSLVSQLTQHGLIDEYQFVVSPILLGGGRSMLSGVTKTTKLELAETRTYPAGNVMLRYVRPSRA